MNGSKGAGRSGWRICRLLLLCEGKRRQGAGAITARILAEMRGAGAGNGQILPAHVLQKSSRI